MTIFGIFSFGGRGETSVVRRGGILSLFGLFSGILAILNSVEEVKVSCLQDNMHPKESHK